MTHRFNKIALIILLLGVPAAAFSVETVRISTGEWPPYLSKNLKHNGVGLHIIRQAFALEGIEVEYQFQPWKRAYKYVKEGVTDASATWSHNSQREQQVYFSDPLYHSTFAFFHLKEQPFDWNTLADLKGLTIGSTGGYSYTPEFLDAAEAGLFTLLQANNDTQNLQMLLLQRTQLFPINIDVGYQLLATEFTPQEMSAITHHPTPFYSKPTYLVFSKHNPNSTRWLNAFNKGLQRLRESGKVDQFFEESRAGKYLMGNFQSNSSD